MANKVEEKPKGAKPVEADAKQKEQPRLILPGNDNFAFIAQLLSEPSLKKAVGEKTGIMRLRSISCMLDSSDAEVKAIGLKVLNGEMEALEGIMKKRHLEADESRELGQCREILVKVLPALDESALRKLIESTKSIQVCMAIMNSGLPQEIREMAEKRVAEI